VTNGHWPILCVRNCLKNHGLTAIDNRPMGSRTKRFAVQVLYCAINFGNSDWEKAQRQWRRDLGPGASLRHERCADELPTLIEGKTSPGAKYVVSTMCHRRRHGRGLGLFEVA